jgi:hypothetical protein
MIAIDPLMFPLRGEGGSPHGISKHRQYLTCPMQATLDEEARRDGQPTSSEGSFTQIGSVFHAFQELYHNKAIKREVDTARIEFTQDGIPMDWMEESRLEGERLFRAYRTNFQTNRYGRVLFVEKLLDMSTAKKRPPWLPEGVLLTGKLDLGVRVSSNTSMRLKLKERVDVPVGLYGVDWKTSSSNHPGVADKYRYDIQPKTYQLMWNWLNPDKPMRGFLISMIIRTTKVAFKTVFIPPVTEEDEEIVYNALLIAKEERERAQPRCNIEACFRGNYPCKWLITGACKRW